MAATQSVHLWLGSAVSPPPWDTTCHYHGEPEAMLSYLLVLDTINFCFWPEEGTKRWEFDFNGQLLSGYHGLASALTQAMNSGVPLTDAHFLATISCVDLQKILGGSGRLQLLDERAQNLNELGALLLARYRGSPCRLVETAEGSALTLVRMTTEQLNSFQDIACYEGQHVFFYKRAQILAADIYGAFNGTGWGAFSDIRQLTAFADYKLPQVLRHLGVLRYSPELQAAIDQHILIAPGSAAEVEIRANTIQAVEMMRQTAEKQGMVLAAHEIDWLLWNMGQEEPYREKPYHRTRTVFY